MQKTKPPTAESPRLTRIKAEFRARMTQHLARQLALNGAAALTINGPKSLADAFMARHLATQLTESQHERKH